MCQKYFNQENYTIAFTPDKPMNDMRTILGYDTCCPQKGNENECIYSSIIHYSFSMYPM